MKRKTKKSESPQISQTEDENVLKEIKPKKSTKRKYVLLYLAIIGFVFYAVITIVNQSVEISDKKAKLADIKQQISVTEIQTQYMSKVEGYKGNKLSEYIETIAKENLGYVSDGERIFINVAGD